MWKLNLKSRVQQTLPEADHWLQAKAEHERAERLAEELHRRRGNREDVRAQLEREAEAGVKLQLQQRDLEWRQKYQVRHLCRAVPGAYTAFDGLMGTNFTLRLGQFI
jgi:ferric-dicitrate binding protein FerR (iron transport regulator)